jgi:sulfur-oxidizing protein SoxY
MSAGDSLKPTRRQWLAAVAGSVLLRPAQATPESLAAALLDFSGGAPLRDGKVRLEVAPLVDNGNTVPVSLSVPEVPPEQVQALALFTERNPQSEVIRASFGPRAGQCMLATRMRLATSQQLVAVARLADGSCWAQRVDVVVTLSACLE